jgi:hypothetical protein
MATATHTNIQYSTFQREGGNKLGPVDSVTLKKAIAIQDPVDSLSPNSRLSLHYALEAPEK